MNARPYDSQLSAAAAISIAPTMTMPWIELAPDIRGVCRVAGTFESAVNLIAWLSAT